MGAADVSRAVIILRAVFAAFVLALYAVVTIVPLLFLLLVAGELFMGERWKGRNLGAYDGSRGRDYDDD
jgi:hypothetical protein